MANFTTVCAPIALAGLLTACGGAPDETSSAKPTATVRTSESIRSEVVRLAEKNSVVIVKIYDPKTVKIEPKKVSCSGRAMLGSAQEQTIYYRDFERSPKAAESGKGSATSFVRAQTVATTTLGGW